MDRKDHQRRPIKFGYILSDNNNELSTSNLLNSNFNNQMNNQMNNRTNNQMNLISPTPSDPNGHLHTPFSSPSPSHSPISVIDYSAANKRIPQQTCRKIDSYYRKTNDNFLKSTPKTERQKSRRQRIRQLDDQIFELEEMYKKLKLSDQDLLGKYFWCTD